VVCVSWEDARAFIQWLSKKTGFKFACGDQISANMANFWSGTGGIAQKDKWRYTSPIKSFSPSPLGLCDMGGNVWEWCQDWYSAFYYKVSPRKSPQGPERNKENETEIKFKVIRGGCWSDQPKRLRCSQRASLGPHQAFGSVGFRLVREE